MPRINGIAWDEDSKYYKELQRWDKSKRDGGMNRDGFEKYPQMLYMAQRHPLSNKHEVAVRDDIKSLDGQSLIFSAEQFNRSCQMTVGNEHEYDMAFKAGWRPSQAEAMELVEKRANEVAEAAAFRAYEDRKLSEPAKAELAQVESSTPEHVVEKPVARVKRAYNRKPKPAVEA